MTIASWELMPAFYEGPLLIVHIIINYYYVCMNIVHVPVGVHVLYIDAHACTHECA